MPAVPFGKPISTVGGRADPRQQQCNNENLAGQSSASWDLVGQHHFAYPGLSNMLLQSEFTAPSGAQSCSLGREPQERETTENSSPFRGDGTARQPRRRPYRGFPDSFAPNPGAIAPGYTTAPLRGVAASGSKRLLCNALCVLIAPKVALSN